MGFGHRKPTQRTHSDEIWAVNVDTCKVWVTVLKLSACLKLTSPRYSLSRDCWISRVSSTTSVCFNIKYIFVRNVQLIHFHHCYSFIAHNSTMIISWYREEKMSEFLGSNHNNLVVAVYENFDVLIYMFAEHSKSISHNVYMEIFPLLTVAVYQFCVYFCFSSIVHSTV